MIAHPQCIGVWFGYPCGTFSSARRHDGGPPPLRGNNGKDIMGLPHLEGKELARVKSANKLLYKMHELMKHCEESRVPFYLKNPQQSKAWRHPLIMKWIKHGAPHQVEYDYCQLGMDWKKPTRVLSVGNSKLHTGCITNCKTVWSDGLSICSRTGQPHETLSGLQVVPAKDSKKPKRRAPIVSSGVLPAPR